LTIRGLILMQVTTRSGKNQFIFQFVDLF